MGDYVKGLIKRWTIYNPYFWLVIAIIFIILIIFFSVAAVINGDLSSSSDSDYYGASSDEQWEQLIKFIAYMEGGNEIYKNLVLVVRTLLVLMQQQE